MKSSDTTQNSPGNSKENVQTRSQDNPLGYEKESKLLVGFAIPCIISMLVTALYNIVDQIFIGQGIGMLGNAATNIAFPLSTTCTAISLLLGIGCATNFSLHLGAGEKDESARYAGNGIFLMAVFGIVSFNKHFSYTNAEIFWRNHRRASVCRSLYAHYGNRLSVSDCQHRHEQIDFS